MIDIPFHIVILFVLALLVCVLGRTLRGLPITPTARRIQALKREIRRLSLEAEQYNSPSTFSTYAKLRREVDRKKTELDTLQGGAFGRITEAALVPYLNAEVVLKFVAWLFVTAYFWSHPALLLPQPTFFPLRSLGPGVWFLASCRVIDSVLLGREVPVAISPAAAATARQHVE